MPKSLKITVSGQYASPGDENAAKRAYVWTLLADALDSGAKVEIQHATATDPAGLGAIAVEKGQ